MRMRNVQVLALDLEGTLISNAVSQFPRPGLRHFLEVCGRCFARLVLFTTVPPSYVRPITAHLVQSGNAPHWFADLEIVAWQGAYKDLRFVGGCNVNEVVLLDDHEGIVHPDQRDQWIPIAEFAPPYPADDVELLRVEEVLFGLVSPSQTDAATNDMK